MLNDFKTESSFWSRKSLDLAVAYILFDIFKKAFWSYHGYEMYQKYNLDLVARYAIKQIINMTVFK